MKKLKSIAVMLLIAAMLTQTIYAADEGNAENARAVYDDCTDFSVCTNHSEEIYCSTVEEESRGAYDSDFTMFMRSSLTAAWVEYEVAYGKYPVFNTYFRQNENIEHFSFLWSSDGENWQTAEPTIKVETVDAWKWIPVKYSLKNLNDSAEFVRIIFSDKNGVEWSPMLASVELADKEYDGLGFADCEGTPYEEAVSLLKSLGFISGCNNYEFRPSEKISRAEFAKILGGVLNIKSGVGERVFADVPRDHYAAAEIAALYGLGIVNGDENGKFNPDANVTYNEAIKMSVCAMGYSAWADDKGGFPVGHIAMANRLGLLGGLTAYEPEAEMSRGDASIMFLNCIDGEIYEQTSFGGNAEFGNKTSILEYCHDIECIDGIVNSAHGISIIDGAETGINQAEINGEIYEASGFDMSDYIGLNVTAYVRKSDNEILYARTRKGKMTEISADKYLYADKNKIYYSDDLQNEKSVTVGENARVVYNGRFLTRMGVGFDLVPRSGYVKIVTDNGSMSSVVLVWDYKSYIAATDGELSKGINNRLGDNLYIDYNSADDVSVIVYGENTDFFDAKYRAGDAVYVAADKSNKIVRIEIVDARISGSVELIDKNDGKITINGEVYELAPDCTELGGSVRAGMNVTAHRDINGRIFAIETSEGGVYAYLYGVGEAEEFGSVRLKLFAQDGEWRELAAHETTKLNGAKNKVSDIAALPSQLVKIKQNAKGELTAIETAAEVSAVGYDGFALNYSSNRSKYYGGNMRLFASLYRLENRTPIFIVPKDRKSVDKYKVAAYWSLFTDFAYNVKLYDVSDEYSVGAATVYTDGSDERRVDSYDNVAVIREAAVINNAEGLPCLKLDVYIKGEEREVYFDNDGGDDLTNGWVPNYTSRATADGNNPFKAGEVIQYYSDSESHCRSFRMLLTRDNIDNGDYYERNTGDYGALSAETYFSELYSAYGAVKNKLSDKLIISPGGLSNGRTIPLAGSVIYVCERGRDRLTKGTLSDINKGDSVFVRMSYADAVDIIVIK